VKVSTDLTITGQTPVIRPDFPCTIKALRPTAGFLLDSMKPLVGPSMRGA
jgi:hypothetical protein